MTVEVLIKNLDTRKDTKEEVHVILEHKSLVRPVYSLHKVLKSGEETKAYVHPGQSVLVKEFFNNKES